MIWFTQTISIFLLLMMTYGVNAGQTVVSDGQNDEFDLHTELISVGQSNLSLRISLKNNLDRKIKILNRDLPWGANGNFVKSIVVDEAIPEPVELVYSIRDFLDEYIELESGKTVVGEINISRLINNEQKTEKPLLVFWLYELREVNGISLGSKSGSIKVK